MAEMRETGLNTKLLEDVLRVSELPLPWEKLENAEILLSGASGLLGSFLVDVLLLRNERHGLGCRVTAIGRDRAAAERRFAAYENRSDFRFVVQDINQPIALPPDSAADYVLHLASNTHPVAYATDPIGTITANIIGTNNLLSFAAERGAKRFLFASSNEIYGENRGDTEFFDESYCGYIDCCTMRAGYPESKRCGEALCLAYEKQKDLDVVITRFTRSYGPTMKMSDTKAISQFLRKGIAGEDIVLKSAGTQYYSYTYVADAVAGLLTVWLCGARGEAYNVADAAGDIMLKDLAAVIAEHAGKKVVFELPDEVESAGYSRATKARLDGGKLKALGWQMQYDIASGIRRTMDILRAQSETNG